MKIVQAHLCNFKNYCGDHSINLSPESGGNKNLILIGGLNGTGKTTLFECIKLCLFGIQFEGKPLAKNKYDKYIMSAKNKKSIKNGDTRFFVSITLQLDDVFPTYSIDLKREWQFEKNQLNEQFVISRNSFPLEIVEQEYWQDYITSLIPPYITDYFFFDGERMKELTVGDKAETILRESARDLMGLKLYETLIKDTSFLERKIIKISENNEKTRQDIEDLEREINNNDQEINDINSKIFILEEKISRLKTKKSEIEFELQRKSGSLAKERENKEREIQILKEDIEKLSLKITDICDYIPFLICNKLVKKTIKKLNEEKKFKEILSNRHLLKEIDVKINERFTDIEKEIPQEHFEYIKSQITEILKDIENEYNLNTENPVIHDITNESFQKIIQFLDNLDSKMKSQFKNNLHDQEGHEFRIKKLENELKSIPDDVLVQEEISLINQIDSQLDIFEKEKNEIAIKKGVIESLSKPLLIKMEKIEYSSLKTQEDTLKVITCQKITRSLKQFVDLILSSKINELEDYIILMHKKLSNKEDLISNIEINPKTFEILIYDKRGARITKEFLSAGEKEIFALSILWGLSKLSKSNLPVIVDSLLARLDTKHVYNVANEFLPNAGDQVIILSHDREVDEKMYKKLKPHLNKNYILSFDQENKISEGYFFDGD